MSSEPDGQYVTFEFQCGPVREAVTAKQLDVVSLPALTGLACLFIEHHFGRLKTANLTGRLLLYRHVSTAENVLEILKDAPEVSNDLLIEIVFGKNYSSTPVSPTEPTRTGNINNSAPAAVAPSATAKSKALPHTFLMKTFTVPTFCKYCRTLLAGVYKQGMQCRDCKTNCHDKCQGMASADTNPCVGEPLAVTLPLTVSPTTENRSFPETIPSGSTSPNSPISPRQEGDKIRQTRLARMKLVKESQSSMDADNNNNTDGQFGGSVFYVQATKSPSESLVPIKEDWLVHFTSKNLSRLRRYWRLCSSSLVLDQSDTGHDIFCEINLDTVYGMEAGSQSPAPHTFQLKTQELVYYIGDKPGAAYSEDWAAEIKTALMPVGRPVSHGADSGLFSPLSDVYEYYQIHPSDVLGVGQFGTVYEAVQRSTNRTVAVKVIDRPADLTPEEAEQMKTEGERLLILNHPGIGTVEGFFENSSAIFVVMEKLNSDLFKYISAAENRRLPERHARFFSYQILVALGYLHSKKIAHCDLKLKNVLLVGDAEYPQVKLCDFNLAKIIGEASFRRSLFGTPAYLAPEALTRTKSYNRLFDMWSLGVIIYVSLAGVLPFYEIEELDEQTKHAHFIFPPHCSEISKNAIDLIQHLLVVEIKSRYTAWYAAQHRWFLDYQMYVDLRNLERRVGARYLTHEADEARWEECRKSRNIPGLAPAQAEYFMATYEDSDLSDDEDTEEKVEPKHSMEGLNPMQANGTGYSPPPGESTSGQETKHVTGVPSPVARSSAKTSKNLFTRIAVDIIPHSPLFSTNRKRSVDPTEHGDPAAKRLWIFDVLRTFFNRRPTLESLQARGIIRDGAVFGCNLANLCASEKTNIPGFVQRCITAIEGKDIDADGLYRISGNLSRVQKLRFQIDLGQYSGMDSELDINVLTGLLKLFFRELKEPLIPFQLYDGFMKANKIQSREVKLQEFRDLVGRIPEPNLDTLQCLFQHLLRVADHADSNRMRLSSLAIVFGPTLMWPEVPSTNLLMDTVNQNHIVEYLLSNFSALFDDCNIAWTA